MDVHAGGVIRYDGTHWAAEVHMPLWTKEKGQGSEILKEIGNLQVAEEEWNTSGRQIIARQPRTMGEGMEI